MTEFKASIDTLAKIITALVFVLLIFLARQSFNAILTAHGEMSTILLHTGALAVMMLVFFGSWLYAPQSYSVGPTLLTINRPAGKIKVNLKEITEIRMPDDAEMSGTIRTFGVGGLWGYYGKFYTPKIGSVNFYATQRINRILIVTRQGKKILITPDDISLMGRIKSLQ